MQEKGFFPLFFDIEDKKVVIIGGGVIGTRRAKVLADFNAFITVISPQVTEELKSLIENNTKKINWIQREYEQGDCQQAFLVIAATSKRQVNESVGREAKEAGVLVTVADRKEESDVFFPGIARKENMVIGITASGRNHKTARKVTDQCKVMLNHIVE